MLIIHQEDCQWGGGGGLILPNFRSMTLALVFS